MTTTLWDLRQGFEQHVTVGEVLCYIGLLLMFAAIVGLRGKKW